MYAPKSQNFGYFGWNVTGHNLPANRSRQLFKPSKDAEVLSFRFVKHWEVSGFKFFVERHNWAGQGFSG